jgi:hypothetical protein
MRNVRAEASGTIPQYMLLYQTAGKLAFSNQVAPPGNWMFPVPWWPVLRSHAVGVTEDSDGSGEGERKR